MGIPNRCCTSGGWWRSKLDGRGFLRNSVKGAKEGVSAYGSTWCRPSDFVVGACVRAYGFP